MHAQTLPDLEHLEAPPAPARAAKFLPQLAAALARAPQPFAYLTTLHPCFIDGIRTLIHRRGLQQDNPSAFHKIRAFAQSHGFALLEDRRKRELTCRDERRRLAPVLMFATGLLSSAVLADDGTLRDNGASVVPTIEVIAERPTAARAYLIEAGKRFVSKPHGTVELILGIAGEVRAQGAKHRVRTRGIQMPTEYSESFVDRYDYTLPADCGGQTFSYYEGDGFAALGYHADRGAIILDVIAGGGPFTAPRLWGPYDQVLNANIRMDLMFGDGLKDGMGLLMASYKIGLMPVMRTGTKNYYGELYSRAVLEAAACVAPPVPTVRQAGTVTPAAVDDQS